MSSLRVVLPSISRLLYSVPCLVFVVISGFYLSEAHLSLLPLSIATSSRLYRVKTASLHSKHSHFCQSFSKRLLLIHSARLPDCLLIICQYIHLPIYCWIICSTCICIYFPLRNIQFHKILEEKRELNSLSVFAIYNYTLRKTGNLNLGTFLTAKWHLEARIKADYRANFRIHNLSIENGKFIPGGCQKWINRSAIEKQNAKSLSVPITALNSQCTNQGIAHLHWYNCRRFI